jgi:hypothetical protein
LARYAHLKIDEFEEGLRVHLFIVNRTDTIAA